MCHFLFEKILQKALQYKKKEVSLQTEILNLLGCRLKRTVTGCSAVGSASGLGPGGRRFESCHPDNLKVCADASGRGADEI